jgi:hypothetical protein
VFYFKTYSGPDNIGAFSLPQPLKGLKENKLILVVGHNRITKAKKSSLQGGFRRVS